MAMITDNPVQDPAASDRIAQIQPCNYTITQIISHHILPTGGSRSKCAFVTQADQKISLAQFGPIILYYSLRNARDIESVSFHAPIVVSIVLRHKNMGPL